MFSQIKSVSTMGNRFELVVSSPVDGWSPALFNGRPLFRPQPIDFHMPSSRCYLRNNAIQRLSVVDGF